MTRKYAGPFPAPGHSLGTPNEGSLMTKFLAVMMFVVASLVAEVAAAKCDGPGPVSFVFATGGTKLPGVEALNLDLGLNVCLEDWNFALTVGSDARLGGPSPIYRLERPILALDIKWQLGDVFAWRLTSRVVFGEVPLPGFFTGPSFTYARYDNFELDLAVLWGKFLFQPGGFTGFFDKPGEDSQGAVMVVFRVLIGPS